MERFLNLFEGCRLGLVWGSENIRQRLATPIEMDGSLVIYYEPHFVDKIYIYYHNPC